MSSILLDYTIDYSLFDSIEESSLELYKIYPLQAEQLSILIATSNKNLSVDELVQIFEKPVKLLFVEQNEKQK